MTPDQYLEDYALFAERAVSTLDVEGETEADRAEIMAEAQTYATLALAAAVASLKSP